MTVDVSREHVDAALDDPARLSAAQRLLATLDERPIQFVERALTRLASVVEAPLAAATVIDGRTQHIIAANDPTALSSGDRAAGHCQYVIASGRYLCIQDMSTESPWQRLTRNLIGSGASRRLEVAYVGFPLRFEDQIVGSVCAVDVVRRVWTPAEQFAVYDAARRISLLLD